MYIYIIYWDFKHSGCHKQFGGRHHGATGWWCPPNHNGRTLGGYYMISFVVKPEVAPGDSLFNPLFPRWAVAQGRTGTLFQARSQSFNQAITALPTQASWRLYMGMCAYACMGANTCTRACAHAKTHTHTQYCLCFWLIEHKHALRYKHNSHCTLGIASLEFCCGWRWKNTLKTAHCRAT